MTKGRAKTPEAKESQMRARVASGVTRSQVKVAGQDTLPLYDAITRSRVAEARIKEARARKDEIANAKQAGELIDASLASDWSAKLVAAVLIESEGLAAHVDLMGLAPEIAAPLRAAALDLARRFRNRVAALPQLTSPPKPGAVA